MSTVLAADPIEPPVAKLEIASSVLVVEPLLIRAPVPAEEPTCVVPFSVVIEPDRPMLIDPALLAPMLIVAVPLVVPEPLSIATVPAVPLDVTLPDCRVIEPVLPADVESPVPMVVLLEVAVAFGVVSLVPAK